MAPRLCLATAFELRGGSAVQRPRVRSVDLAAKPNIIASAVTPASAGASTDEMDIARGQRAYDPSCEELKATVQVRQRRSCVTLSCASFGADEQNAAHAAISFH
jgi:hypothetical protein